jgi:hypothetical protein
LTPKEIKGAAQRRRPPHRGRPRLNRPHLFVASPFWVGTSHVWYGRRVSAKGFSNGTPDFAPGRALIARGLAEIIRVQIDHAVFPIFATQKDQNLIVHDFNFSHFRVIEDLNPGPFQPIDRPI